MIGPLQPQWRPRVNLRSDVIHNLHYYGAIFTHLMWLDSMRVKSYVNSFCCNDKVRYSGTTFYSVFPVFIIKVLSMCDIFCLTLPVFDFFLAFSPRSPVFHWLVCSSSRIVLADLVHVFLHLLSDPLFFPCFWKYTNQVMREWVLRTLIHSCASLILRSVDIYMFLLPHKRQQ